MTADALDPLIHDGPASRTSVTLTIRGRAALDAYAEAMRGLLGEL